MNEEMIILLAKEGHEDAFKNLFEKHREMVYRLAYRYTRSMHDAEDILQETFIKAFINIKKFDYKHRLSFSAWLNRICINHTIQYLRKCKRQQLEQTDVLSNKHIDLEAEGLSPEEFADLKHTQILIQNAIKKLSPKQRIIFDLRYAQHLNINEIAEYMACSESSVKTHLARSISKLRNLLKPLWRE